MIESALRVFQETTLDRRIKAMVETKVIGLHKFAKREASNVNKTSVDQAVQNVVRRVDTQSIIKEIIDRKVDSLAEIENFVHTSSWTLSIIRHLQYPSPFRETAWAIFRRWWRQRSWTRYGSC